MSTKRALNSFVLLANSLGVTALMTYYLSSPAIFSPIDAGYWHIWVSVFLLINKSNILTCSESFLDCLQPRSFGTKGIDVGGA